MSVADNHDGKVDTVGLFLRAMVDREPGKRKVKASKAALIDLAQMDMGDSSDDSDFNVDEAKLNDDDDISINSDPDAEDPASSSGEDEDDDEEGSEGEDLAAVAAARRPVDDRVLTVNELLERAQQKQQLDAQKGAGRPQILVCAVCLGDNSDDTNEIVTCDGWCHVSVHEGCYGVSDTVSVSSTVSSCSTEPWFCDACKAGVRNPPCELCPNLGYSIFKETEMGRWVHLVCALYVPGVAFSEVDKLSFPTLFEMAYSRWGSKVCSLCEDTRYAKTGVCIGCDAGMCRSYFHVTCAQREGLLSEVNHGEADQADPYYAHCKLHTDRELIRRRKRNWLTLQLHTKQADQMTVSTKEQSRLERKLVKYRDKYVQVKASRPTPWYPTQKMPRAIGTCASVFRTLLHKTQLMGLSTETQEAELTAVGDIRKKWHIPPAFSVEFTSYYVDRSQRLKEMKRKLEVLLSENSSLSQEEAALKEALDKREKENKLAAQENAELLAKSLELHNLLKGLAGRPLPLPPVVAAIHNPPSPALPPMPAQVKPGSVGGRETRRVMTKAAAKMLADPPPAALASQHQHDPYNTCINNHQQQQQQQTPSTITVPGSSPSATTAAAASRLSSSTPSPSKGRGATAGSATGEPSAACVSVGNRQRGAEGGVLAAVGQEPHMCSVCRQATDQNLQIQCDTCTLFYHLCCLDPPLTRMPKKTKQMGWQCSDCCKSSDSEKLAEVDTSAPRRLRRVIKEPAKFSPSLATADQKTVHERSPPCSSAPSEASSPPPLASAKLTNVDLSPSASSTSTPGAAKPAGGAIKRRRSSDGATGRRAASGAQKRAKKLAAGAGASTTSSELESSAMPAENTDPDVKLVAEKKEEPCLAGGSVSPTAGRAGKTGAVAAQTDAKSNLDKVEKVECKDIKETETPEKAGKTIKSSPSTPSRGARAKRTPVNSEYPLSESDRAHEDQQSNLFNQTSLNADTRYEVTITPTAAPVSSTNTTSTTTISIPSAIPSTQSKPVVMSTTPSVSSAASLSSSLGSGIAATITSIAGPVSSAGCQVGSSTTTSSASLLSALPVCIPTHPLDMSADSLPSVASLHSPTSESLHSHEEDNQPHSPRKEKRHRDGSKKKKKDKDRDKEKAGEKAEKKRKKHHHSYWDAQPHQSSEMLAPLRLKIKPLPPRPPEAADAFLPSTQGSVSITRLSQPTSGSDGAAATGRCPTSSDSSPHKLVTTPQHVPPLLTYPGLDGGPPPHQTTVRHAAADLTLSTTSLSSTPIAHHMSSSSSATSSSTSSSATTTTATASSTLAAATTGSVTITSVAGPASDSSNSSTDGLTTLTTTTTAVANSSTTSNSSSSGGAPPVAPPPGYPPLPPGYTLTQPLLAGDVILSSANVTDKGTSGAAVTAGSAAGTGGVGSRRSGGSGSGCSVSGAAAAASGGGRRKSDGGGGASGQQFSKCDVCKETGGVTNTVACDDCHKAYHFNCLDPPLKKSPKRRGYSWFCEDCEPSK